MKEKLKDDKFVKDLLYKFLSVVILAIVTLLLLNVMSQNKDGRSQIIDDDGGSEYTGGAIFTSEEQRLTEILKGIKGVGEVSVMLTYEQKEGSGDFFSGSGEEESGKVKGAVIIASGGGDAVAQSNILKAVTALFDIPVQNVRVFEKAEEGNK
ncbi:hypothetical protein MASR2M70_01920 [Bacillota bacterium]